MIDGLTISVVSHNQSSLVENLFASLKRIGFDGRIICTSNCGKENFRNTEGLNISYIVNEKPLGFGQNHNQAFAHCDSEYFAVVNPDVQFLSEITGVLINRLRQDPRIAVITSGSINSLGEVQDNIRQFPTVIGILLKLIGRDPTITPALNQGLLYPDWISGQFMLFRNTAYANLNGFSSKYFMYYEDVDLCRRVKNSGFLTAVDTDVVVVHDAQRSSHKNLRLFFIHLKSTVTYFLSR